MTLGMLAGVYFVTNDAYPKEEWQQTSEVSTIFLKNRGLTNLDPIANNLQTLKDMSRSWFQENAKSANKMREYLFKVEQIKKQFTNLTSLSYNNNLLTIHSHYLTDVVDKPFHDSLTQKLKSHLDQILKKSIQAELQTLDAEIKKTQLQIFQANEKIPEAEKPNDTTKSSDKPTELDVTSSIPNDIRNNLKMFKEYKSKKEARLKEIDEIISTLPELGSTPLVMLSSNLYNNYLSEKQAIETKLQYLDPTSAERQVAKDQMAILDKKIDIEEKKLRDESYFLKGERDKALRLKKHTLMQEKENLKDTLQALNEFQKLLFQQDQPLHTSHNTTQLESGKVNDQTISHEERLRELDASMVKLTRQKEDLIAVGNEINEKGLILSNQKPITKIMHFYNDAFVLSTSAIFILCFWLFSALLFGTKPKVVKGEHAAHLLRSPFLGEMPTIPNQGFENAKNKKLTDAIDNIAKKTLDQIESQNVKSISIISLDPQDGRTQLTGMLSLSFNLNHDMKIIAMDTHFSKPSLKDFLELKNKMLPTDDGIISYLKQLDQTKEITETENNQWLAKLVKPCVKNGIFVISPGKGPLENPSIFNTKALDTMNTGLSKYVDLIIFDTAPIRSDNALITKTLMNNCDGSILILRKGNNTIKQLEELRKDFQSSKIIGVVFKV